MRKIVGRIASIGTVGLVAAATLAMSTSTAQAASYWSSSAPKYATNVGTVTSKTVTVTPDTYTLQIRSGKWGGNYYLWARVPNPAGDAGDNDNLWLEVYNPTTKKWTSSGSTPIKSQTTYSKAHRSIAGWGYKACAKDNILGGSPAKCITWWV
ncbi:hypothetical protein [Nonomuraea sp. SYSU D8015]|uniref:hypothetical protein n=1 Tax=Nonomuraea sp. SYSU D8015 TaxID=2593644 RepID=UPI001660B6E1|nr:hypothetical protein [Nonomuraea sp. SYSU D8015]